MIKRKIITRFIQSSLTLFENIYEWETKFTVRPWVDFDLLDYIQHIIMKLQNTAEYNALASLWLIKQHQSHIKPFHMVWSFKILQYNLSINMYLIIELDFVLTFILLSIRLSIDMDVTQKWIGLILFLNPPKLWSFCVHLFFFVFRFNDILIWIMLRQYLF